MDLLGLQIRAIGLRLLDELLELTGFPLMLGFRQIEDSSVLVHHSDFFRERIELSLYLLILNRLLF